MNPRFRLLIVVVMEAPRTLRMVSSEPSGHPSRDVARMAAQLLGMGAEVRVLDQSAELLANRVVRRELKRWRPDLVLIHAGGGHLADDPLPVDKPLRDLLSGWDWPAPALVCGPLAWHYGPELLKRHGRLTGALVGAIHPRLLARGEVGDVPGVVVREGGLPAEEEPVDGGPEVLPAWHVLPLESYPGRGELGLRCVGVGALQDDLDATAAEVRHAVNRAGARFLILEDRDLGARPEHTARMAHRMFGLAPGVPWSCRVRADHVDPSLVLALANGGCQEVLIASAAEDDAPASAPMDDQNRARIEVAVEAVRVTGMSAIVRHVVGRPGHTRTILEAWHRWFRDRAIVVRPHVRVQHRGPDDGWTLDQAHDQAGCVDNELQPSDVERAVRTLGGRVPLAGQLAP